MHEPRDPTYPLDQIAEQRWDDQRAQFSDRITEQTHRLLMQARTEATRFDSLAVSTDHLLLALLRESDAGGALVLRQLGIDLLRVHDLLVRRSGPPGSRVRAGEAGLTPLAMQGLLLAWEEARRLGHRRAGPEHVLLGLWRVGDGIAGQILSTLGVSLEQARLRVMRLEHGQPGRGQQEPPVPDSGPASDTTITCQLDQRDLDAIDALVAAGASASRSEAVSWLVHAGLAAHAGLVDTAYRTVADIQQLRDKVRTLTQQTGGNATNASPAREAPAQAPNPPEA